MDPHVLSRAHEAVSHHARSFRWASHFLPVAARDDAAILYALCREIDDAADEAPSPAEARRALGELRAELSSVRPQRPLIASYWDVARRRSIGREVIFELLEGVESDLSEVRVEDDRELLRYCYRVAGTVGLMMCGVLEAHDRQARTFAIDLGMGMQLTNICRDVAEDARNGRVYLPASRLHAVGTSPEALLRGLARPGPIVAVTADLLDLAERYYHSAEHATALGPFRPRLAVLAGGRIYRAIGRRLRRKGGNPLEGRTIVPWTEKLYWMAGAAVSALRPGPASPDHDPELHRLLSGLPEVDERGASDSR